MAVQYNNQNCKLDLKLRFLFSPSMDLLQAIVCVWGRAGPAFSLPTLMLLRLQSSVLAAVSDCFRVGMVKKRQKSKKYLPVIVFNWTCVYSWFFFVCLLWAFSLPFSCWESPSVSLTKGKYIWISRWSLTAS